jgi:hypothetical protein
VLEECVGKAGLKNNWQQAGEVCVGEYGKGLEAELRKEINRVISL